MLLNAHFIALRFRILPLKLTNSYQFFGSKLLMLLAKKGKVTPSQMGFITTECRTLVVTRGKEHKMFSP